MALNAGASISKNTEQILQIIRRECRNATEWWRRENEGQQRYINALYRHSLQVQAEKSAALAEASRAKDEVERHKAELERHKQEDASRWKAELQRYKAEVHSWKLRYEAAVNSRDDALRQLTQTQARFSLTLVPLSQTEASVDGKRPAPVLDTPMRSHGLSMAETPPCDSLITSPSSVPSSGSKRKKRYPAAILYPSPASAAAASSNTNAATVASYHPKKAASLAVDVKPDSVVPSNTLSNRDHGAVPVLNATSLSSVPAGVQSSASTDPPTTIPGSKNCYCNAPEYGEMIKCSNPACPKHWFHISCTGLKHAPKGDWLCTYCSTPSSPPQPMPPPDTPMHNPHVP